MDGLKSMERNGIVSVPCGNIKEQCKEWASEVDRKDIRVFTKQEIEESGLNIDDYPFISCSHYDEVVCVHGCKGSC